MFSYFLAVDLSLLSYFSFDGFVDSVPLDDFVQIGHEHHNLIADSSDFLNLFNVDIIKCSDLFLKKWDDQRLKRSIRCNNNIIPDNLFIYIRIKFL